LAIYVQKLTSEERFTLKEMHKKHPLHLPRKRAHAILLSMSLQFAASMVLAAKQLRLGFLNGKKMDYVDCLIAQGVEGREN